MAFLTIEELSSHLYGEQIDVITREDETITQASIDGAVAECKGYLGDYDKDAVFNACGSDRHPLLLIFAKDIAVWHLINLSNPGIDIEYRRSRYTSAIAWLKGVQKGDITPNLPVSSKPSSNLIQYGSNPKRNNHF